MLAKKNRLKKARDFRNIFKRGRLIRGQTFDLRWAANEKNTCRFGFSVGISVSGKAVIRNKTKRMLNGSIQPLLDEIKSGYDILIIAKPKIIEKSKEEIAKNVEEIIKKASLFA